MIKWTFLLSCSLFHHPALRLDFPFFGERHLKPEAYFLQGLVCKNYLIFGLLYRILDFQNSPSDQSFLATQVYFFLVQLGRMHSWKQQCKKQRQEKFLFGHLKKFCLVLSFWLMD